jgi:hypothetical protein
VNEVHHSVDLDLYYSPVAPQGGGRGMEILFEDGVRYTMTEALHISRDELQGDDLRALHLVKRITDGQLLPGTAYLGFAPDIWTEAVAGASAPGMGLEDRKVAGDSLKRVKHPSPAVGIDSEQTSLPI